MSAPRHQRYSEGGGLATVPGVEIFASGQHREDGTDYTDADLRDMVRNFQRFSTGPKPLVQPPAVVGHEEEGEPGRLMDATDVPAVGWPKRLWLERQRCPAHQGDDCPVCGGKGSRLILKGDVGEVPRKFADLLRSKAYRKVSAEVYDDPPRGVPGKGKMLRRIAFLGGAMPEIKTLADVPAPRYSEAPKRRTWLASAGARRLADGAWRCFSEVRAMPLTGKGEKIKGAMEKEYGPKKGQEVFYASQNAGTISGVDRHNEGSMNRDEMVKKLSEEHGFDPEHLKPMPDDKLAEMCQKYDEAPKEEEEAAAGEANENHIGEGGGTGGDGQDVDEYGANDPSQEGYKGAGSEEQEEPVARNGLGGEPTPRKTTHTVHEFSEQGFKAFQTQLYRRLDGIAGAFEKTLKGKVARLDKFAEERIAAEKRATVDARLEVLLKQGKVLPAEIDAGLADDLYATDAVKVRKFSESGKTVSRTHLEHRLAVLEARPVLLKYGERVKSSKGGAAAAEDAETEKVRAFAEGNEEFGRALKAAGSTPARHVAKFAELRKANPEFTAAQYGVPVA